MDIMVIKEKLGGTGRKFRVAERNILFILYTPLNEVQHVFIHLYHPILCFTPVLGLTQYIFIIPSGGRNHLSSRSVVVVAERLVD